MQLTLRMISAAGFADADLGLPEVPTVTEIYIPSAFVLWIRICELLGVGTAGLGVIRLGVICGLDHRSVLVMHTFENSTFIAHSRHRYNAEQIHSLQRMLYGTRACTKPDSLPLPDRRRLLSFKRRYVAILKLALY